MKKISGHDSLSDLSDPSDSGSQGAQDYRRTKVSLCCNATEINHQGSIKERNGHTAGFETGLEQADYTTFVRIAATAPSTLQTSISWSIWWGYDQERVCNVGCRRCRHLTAQVGSG